YLPKGFAVRRQIEPADSDAACRGGALLARMLLALDQTQVSGEGGRDVDPGGDVGNAPGHVEQPCDQIGKIGRRISCRDGLGVDIAAPSIKSGDSGFSAAGGFLDLVRVEHGECLQDSRYGLPLFVGALALTR